MPLFANRNEFTSELSSRVIGEMPLIQAQIASGDDLLDLPGKFASIVKMFMREKMSVGKLGITIDDITIEATVRLMEGLYDQYISPLDIPGVPNVAIEPLVDAAVRMGIRPAVSAVMLTIRSKIQ